MKISIGSDHRGYDLKTFLMRELQDIEWFDKGTTSSERADYPVYAAKVCDDLTCGDAQRGILICGSGIGMSIAANRRPGIFAALCWNPDIARLARQDDNANVLVLPADFVSEQEALLICKQWFDASFKGGRYQDRLEMIDAD